LTKSFDMPSFVTPISFENLLIKGSIRRLTINSMQTQVVLVVWVRG